MNDKGVSYNGSKKLSNFTGQEEVYDVPVQTVEGEDIGNLPALTSMKQQRLLSIVH